MAVPHCFQLIHALSATEKRTFSVYARRHVIGGETRYLRLFEIIEAMPDYHESVLRQQMLSAGLPVKWVKADLNYLYKLLLEHLRLIHRDKSAHMQVSGYLTEIEILVHKGLIAAAEKHIHKAIALAQAIEAWDVLQRIYLWQRRIAVTHPESGLSSTKIVSAITQAQAKLEQFNTALHLYEEAAELRKLAVQKRDTQTLRKFDALLKHPLFAIKSPSLPILTKIRSLQVQGMRHYAKRAFEDEYQVHLHIIAAFNKHPLLRAAYAADYAAIHARVISILKNKDQAAFQQALLTFRQIQPTDSEVHAAYIDAYVFAQSYMVELSAYLAQGAYETAYRLLQVIDKGLHKHRMHIGDGVRFSFDFMSTYTLFANGHYAEARLRMHQLLNAYSKELRPDVFQFARLLDLMIHLAMGNYSNIRSAHASVAYQFKKHPRLYAIENRILKYFSHPRFYSGRDQFIHLEQLADDLQQISKKGREQLALGYIDFYRWIRSRREKVPMSIIR
jgi:hypothetical protein